ncbi:MAG: lipopolysaccharide assembly protein LapB [Gammaproteobacteria bacterium]|nr:lipopolysaccharide assembly protein LapB [Gammaproteobacteria bacterium]
MPLDLADLLFGILLFVAIIIGWLLGKAERRKPAVAESSPLSKEYFHGLNLLLNEKQDEAMELLLKTLDVNRDTFETYLVMGNLYRRRGEVDRSIRIHQDLLAKPDLGKLQQATVRLELARDYLKAGLLDRSERLLKELADEAGPNQLVALEYLLSIYELEKEWRSAVETAEKLGEKGRQVTVNLSHYHCEQAEQAVKLNDLTEARRELKQALATDRNCVRASLLQAKLETHAGNDKESIKSLRRVLEQDPQFIPETLDLLRQNYTTTEQLNELVKYLFTCLEQHPSISTVLVLSDLVRELEGDKEGAYVLAEYLKNRPTVKGLDRLIRYQMDVTDAGPVKENLALLQVFTQRLIQDKPVYRCEKCGFNGKTLHWQCPGCKSWGTVKPIHGIEGE